MVVKTHAFIVGYIINFFCSFFFTLVSPGGFSLSVGVVVWWCLVFKY